MIKIKIDIPCQDKNLQLNQFLCDDNNIYKDCQLFVNSATKEADYLFILDDIQNSIECKIAKENIYLLCAETFLPKGYYSNKNEFLNQFAKIYSCHDIFLDNIEYDLPFLPWMIYSGYHSNIFNKEISYSIIENLNPQKTKILSMICSGKAYNEHHSLRLRFAQQIKEHFKDKVDWFGNGINPVDNKSDAILPYKYHLALENYSSVNNITEKLYDSYLGLAYPIYYGAPNVNSFFPQNSLSQINIRDLKGSIKIIEEAIEQDLYTKRLDLVKESRNLVLNEYNLFKRIVNIALSQQVSYNKENITLNGTYYYDKKIKYTKLHFLGKGIRKIGQKIIDLSA